MTTTANATFAVQGWDEKTWEGVPQQEAPDPKVTYAVVTYTYTGDLEGESEMRSFMSYNKGHDTHFVGIERFVGKLHGSEGTFVLQHTGRANGMNVQAEYFVVPGSGTGDLTGLRGEGHSELSGHAEHYPFALSYELG
ncbi:MAG: DUF3224 domain-containing protein [Caldilineaceae bacterium]|nr:DUF3224 domain-containing protein [Caldilineaceae bacterium]